MKQLINFFESSKKKKHLFIKKYLENQPQSLFFQVFFY
ncbi:hypothetical protein EFS1_2022 [Enterococcus faecalis str. Symbioflor 1]|nr:hypothetical protein EFS1_2022 [Enterococcus faecalis str. Symbioflor 1]